MPAQEEAFLFDEAVIWEAAGVDKHNEPVILTPYKILVGWDNKSYKSIDNAGQPVRFDASIQTSEEYPLGSIFWLGKLEDFEDETTPALFRSVSKEETYDIRGIEIERRYNLLRFNTTLPEIVGTG